MFIIILLRVEITDVGVLYNDYEHMLIMLYYVRNISMSSYSGLYLACGLIANYIRLRTSSMYDNNNNEDLL